MVLCVYCVVWRGCTRTSTGTNESPRQRCTKLLNNISTFRSRLFSTAYTTADGNDLRTHRMTSPSPTPSCSRVKLYSTRRAKDCVYQHTHHAFSCSRCETAFRIEKGSQYKHDCKVRSEEYFFTTATHPSEQHTIYLLRP